MTGLGHARAIEVESGATGRIAPACHRSPLLLAALLAASPAQARPGHPSVAFFYGQSVPVAELSHFDWVVVEPGHLDARGLADLQRAGVEVFGYLSLGEAAPGEVDPGWVLGRNAAWGTVILNPASPGWRQRILDRADALWERGYRGLFLDTLDSHVSALRGEQARRAAGAALAGLVRALHDRHPGLKLFFNRGFEILDQVGRLACGLAAESLYFGWDAAAKRYVEVPEADRQWLVERLRSVADRFRIPVVVVDYLPPARRGAAREAARRIEAMGFTPWISTSSLDVLGVGSVEVIPRRALLLYDGAEAPDLAQAPIHRLAALPLESLGCAVDYLDVRRGLPQEPLAGRYAGIVTWFTDDDLPQALGYQEWLGRQMEAGVRVAMLGRPGFAASKGFLARLGLAAAPAAPSPPLRIVNRDEMVGFEAQPEPRRRGLLAWHAAAPEATVHLHLEDGRGQPIDPVVTAPWGGLAFAPYLLEPGYQGRQRWIVDPFAFLQAALRLPPAPALDLTTENGARLMVVVADAGGLGRPAEERDATAAEGILRLLPRTLPVPTTVAISPGELRARRGGRVGIDPLARALLALPGVEAAVRFSTAVAGAASPEGEVQASVAPLRELLPRGKEPRAFLWPDDAATPGRLAAAAELGMVNLAGFRRRDAEPSLTGLLPSGRPVGDRFEVYLPGREGSRASSEWEPGWLEPPRPPAFAERAAIPPRLEPLGLHFPLRIGTRPAAVRSLARVLRRALDEGALPLWSSEYARRVRGFQEATVARRLDGTWQFRGMGALRTVRLPRALGWPDPSRSRGLAAVAEVGAWRYLSFGPEERPTLALSPRPVPGPHLAWANAPLARWTSGERRISLRLDGHVPVRLAVAGAPGSCTLTVEGRKVRPGRSRGLDTFFLADADTGEATLECRE